MYFISFLHQFKFLPQLRFQFLRVLLRNFQPTAFLGAADSKCCNNKMAAWP